MPADDARRWCRPYHHCPLRYRISSQATSRGPSISSSAILEPGADHGGDLVDRPDSFEDVREHCRGLELRRLRPEALTASNAIGESRRWEYEILIHPQVSQRREPESLAALE